MIFNQTITRKRAGTRTDRAGDDVPDWTNTADTVYTRVSVQPAQDTEAQSGERDTRVTGWTVYTRPGVDVDVNGTDRVIYDGRPCRVIGEVKRYPHPTRPGRVHHVEFSITYAEG